MIIIEIKTRNTINEEHVNIKRTLNGDERRRIGSSLKGRSCTTFRHEIARKRMKENALKPPNLYSSDVLRQVKKEYVDKELNINPLDSRDILKAIETMFFTPPTYNVIKAIGSVPFHVFYSSEQQLTAYKEYSRISKNASQICVDATGSVVKKLNRPNNFKSGHIFLYAIVINFNKKKLAVHHMLSEKHENEFIAYWLQQWQRTAPVPAQAVCDYSKALLQGLSKAFNDCSIKDYVDKVFKWAQANQDKNIKPVSTFILVDVAHLIHLCSRKDCFNNKKKNKYLKKFFVRCIALLVDCDTVEEFAKIFQLTCIVANQTHFGNVLTASLVDTPRDALHVLEKLISDRSNQISDIIDSIADYPEKHASYSSIEGNEVQKKTWKKSIRNRTLDFSKCKVSTCRGKELNAYFLPDFIHSLKLIAKEFPLWAAIHKLKDRKHSSSSYIESYFKDLKNRVLKPYQAPLLVHKFLKIHIDDLIGASNLFISALKQYQLQGNKIKAVTAISDVDESLVSNEAVIEADSPLANTGGDFVNLEDSYQKSYENWRGLATIKHQNLVINEDHSYYKSNNATSLYFKNYPQIKDINLNCDRKIPLFKNGNRCEREVIAGLSIRMFNTCGVDSILQILSTAALVNNNYQSYLQSSATPALKLVWKLSMATNITADILYDRAVILSQVYALQFLGVDEGYRVDCFDSITNIYETIMKSEPSLSKKFECPSQTCENATQTYHYLSMNLKILNNNLANLEKSIEFHDKLVKVQCLKCHNKGTLSSYTNRQIIIDMDTTTFEHQSNSFALKKFPAYLKLGRNECR